MKHTALLSFVFAMCLLSCNKGKLRQKEKPNNPFYLKAFDFQEKGKVDSAYIYFSRAKDLFIQQTDSLSVGICLANMGYISNNTGDYSGAQESALHATSYFDKKNKDQFSYIKFNYNVLGFATHKLANFEQALKFYDLAIKFSTDQSDILSYLNSKATIYQQLKNYNEALKIYGQIVGQTLQNQKEYARILTNISATKWLQNPNFNPIPDFLKALQIRIKENDVRGQNSSYSHLKDYYSTTQQDSALFYAHKMYLAAKIIDIPDDKLMALQTLIRFSSPKETKQYFEIYQNLSDSVQAANDADKNQFAIFRFDLEKSKSQNLELQKDNTEKKYQIIKREILLYGAIFVLFAGAIFVVFWYRKRKQRLALESENTIRESQLRTSKKVHDVVANGLYRVMTEVENQDEIDKETILDKLDHMYQKSRDISYEVEEKIPAHQNFQHKIATLVQSFSTQNISIVTKGNSKQLWEKVGQQAKNEVEHILQELLINMKKHSGASSVKLQFEVKNNISYIYYQDNGIGIAEDIQFKNGLINTGTRIEHIHGEIIFERKVERGLKIQISFPIF